MLGKFTFFIARTLPTVSVTLCNTSVIGTRYIREEPLLETIDVSTGSLTSFTVPHVHAVDIIGNILAISLRLGPDTDITSILFTNDTEVTKVTIDATLITPGTYSLQFESFDTNSGVFSTLKIDKITVVVTATPEVVVVSERKFLPIKIITSGKESFWSISTAFERKEDIEKVKFLPNKFIGKYLTFKESLETISYDGRLVDGVKSQTMFKITVTIFEASL